MVETMDARRRETNPLYNDRKLKLGTFGQNLDRGCAISTIDGVLEINWPNTMAIAKMADEMGFEALVPVGRWKGFGGVTNFNGPGFECFSWAAGVGASTQNPAIFSTAHVLTIHPIMAAKQAATIDHITGGRFALNVVTGWHRSEIEMFGAPLLDHEVRYGLAVEWLEIIKRLWTEDEEFDFDGKHFQIKKGYLAPKPIQKPFPVVMNAGNSETGRHYAAKYCDIAFVNINRGDPEVSRAVIAELPQVGARGVRPRPADLGPRLRRPGRDRKGGERLFRRIRPPEGRLGGRQQPGRDHGPQHAALAGVTEAAEDAFHRAAGAAFR